VAEPTYDDALNLLINASGGGVNVPAGSSLGTVGTNPNYVPPAYAGAIPAPAPQAPSWTPADLFAGQSSNTPPVYPTGVSIKPTGQGWVPPPTPTAAPPSSPTDATATPGAPGGGPPAIVYPGQQGAQDAASPLRTVKIPASNTPLADPKSLAALKGERDAEGDAIAAQATAATNAGQDEAAKALAIGSGLQGEEDAQKGQAADESAAADKRQADAMTRLDRIDQASQTLADQKIDPDRWWGSRTSAQRVSLTIASALSGWLQGSKGGSNSTLDMISQNIDRDIDAQKADIANKGRRLDEMNNLYARAYQVTGDHAEAEHMAKGILYNAAKTETARLAAVADTPIAQDKAAELTAQITAKQHELAGASDKEQIGYHAYSPGGTVTIGGPSSGAPLSDKDAGKLVTINGKQVLAPTDDAAKEVRGKIEAQTRVDNLLGEAQELRKDPSSYSPIWTTKGQRLRAVKQELTLALKEPGVRFSEGEAERLEAMTGNITAPPGLGGTGADENLAALRRERRDAAAKYVASQGWPVIQTGYALDPKTGNRVRTGALTGSDYASSGPAPGSLPPGAVPIK
jgi:hypothetical protein